MVTKEGAAIGEISFSMVVVVGVLMAHVDKWTKIVRSFLSHSVMICGAWKCGYSVWKWAKNKNESGVVHWQRKISWWVKSVFCQRRPWGRIGHCHLFLC